MLHITNGDATGLEDAELGGTVVRWRDVLHDGPVPALPLAELSEVRARFLADSDFGSPNKIRLEFQARDRALAAFRDHDEVCLWFEHDLYDQLQLLQILDFFASAELGGTALTLICINEFPGVEPFHGLGQLSGAQLATLWPAREPVLEGTLELARRSWRAFTAPDPLVWATLLGDDLTAMPYLRAAVRRLLQQCPAPVSGLCRTERQILQAILDGARTREEIFLRERATEEAVWAGDTTVFRFLDNLGPLVARANDEYTITPVGRAVFEGERDWVELQPPDRWIGGVHLVPGEPFWRWDDAHSRLVRYH